MKRRTDFFLLAGLIGGIALCAPLMVEAGNGADPDFDVFGDCETEGSLQGSRVDDPLIGYNRAMFYVNDFLYLGVIEPVASAYTWAVPEAARVGIKRFFQNLGWPKRLINNCLQGKWRGAGTETERFLINTTVGILGFGDPALNSYGLEPAREDFGQTLAVYGIGDGSPVTLPLMGPSNARDAIGKIPDFFLSPISYFMPWVATLSVRAYEIENYNSLHIGEYRDMKEAALDPYIFFRDAYKQSRDKRIAE